MAIADSFDNNKKEKLVQFEKCEIDEKCVYRDTNGRCVFETCIYDVEYPPTQMLWFFECQACGDVTSRKPRDMKIMLCDRCLNHLRNSMRPKAICCICGDNIGNYPKSGFGTCICDSCVSRLRKSAYCHYCQG